MTCLLQTQMIYPSQHDESWWHWRPGHKVVTKLPILEHGSFTQQLILKLGMANNDNLKDVIKVRWANLGLSVSLQHNLHNSWFVIYTANERHAFCRLGEQFESCPRPTVCLEHSMTNNVDAVPRIHFTTTLWE